MIYNSSNTGFIFRYIGGQQIPIPGCLDSFLITMLCKDIFHAMIMKMRLMAHPKSESEVHEI